jgi:hypothetical protein
MTENYDQKRYERSTLRDEVLGTLQELHTWSILWRDEQWCLVLSRIVDLIITGPILAFKSDLSLITFFINISLILKNGLITKIGPQ